MVYRVGDIALSGGSVQRVTVLTAASYSRGRNFFQRSPQHSFRNDHRGDLLVADRRGHRFRCSHRSTCSQFLQREALFARIDDEEIAESAAYPIEQHFGVDPTQQALSQSATVSGLLPLVLLSGVIIAPIAEEIVFRGYLYKAFRDRFKPWYAIVMSAALFSAIHLEPLAAVPLFVIGVVLAYVYEKTDNLMAPIALHMLNNAVAFLVVALDRKSVV